MEMDKTIAWRLSDLVGENKLADRKLQEIRSFDAQNLKGVKSSEDQNEILSKELEIRKQVVANLEKDLVDKANEIEELNEEKEALSNVLDERETRVDSLEKAQENNRINLEKELKQFEESHAKNIQECLNEIERERNESNHNFHKKEAEINKKNGRLNQNIITLKKENADMANELREMKDKRYQSYIGLVCLILQAYMYRFVLPDQFAENRRYKVKDIEEDIDDEDLLSDEEREEASKRWEDLKDKLGWESSLERTLKILQKEANPCRVLPENLTVEEVERAAEELKKRGRLKGRTSYEKVKKVIQMWKICAHLVQSLQLTI